MYICVCSLCFYFLKSSELGVFVYFSICFLKRERERENEDSVLEGYGGGENLGGVGRGETEIRT